MVYVYDMLTVVGVALIAVGAYLIYPPAAFVAAGVLLLGLGLMAGRGAAMERKREQIAALQERSRREAGR